MPEASPIFPRSARGNAENALTRRNAIVFSAAIASSGAWNNQAKHEGLEMRFSLIWINYGVVLKWYGFLS
jgi:hypothetical protein